MKILTVNYHFSNSYGAVLEAYALQKFLGKYSDETLCVNFVIRNDESFTRKISRRLSNFIFNSAERKRYFEKILTHKGVSSEKDAQSISLQCRYSQSVGDVFDIFRKRYLRTTPGEYHTCSELRKSGLSEDADIVICGSDVIWYVHNSTISDDVYFLSWVSDDTAKIAYAPSWGAPNIDKMSESKKKRLSGYLARFDALSVREKSGVDICAALGRSDAQWVPDPTILLTAAEWNKIAESKLEKRYVLNFHIPYGWNSSVDDTKILAAAAEHYSAPVIKIPDLETDYVWLSPTEWIGAVRDAEFVVTNSFHGVVFCIIYNKDFIFTKIIGEQASFNERIYSLLDLFGLKDRIADESIASDSEKAAAILESRIDWKDVNQKLSKWRQVGADYLKKAVDS